MLADVKAAMRITVDVFDGEILDLIASARADMKRVGVLPAKADDDADPLIRRGIIWYCKAYFGFDNADSEKAKQAYDFLRTDLALNVEYTAST